MKHLLVLITLVAVSFSFSQDEKADKILNTFSNKVKGSSSFYLEFSANIKNASSGTNENNTGKGWVKGDKYYASYGELTRISNGKKTWTILKEEKSVYISDEDGDEESVNPKKLMTLWDTGFKSKYEKETKNGADLVHMINLYPKNPKTADYHTITLYIGKNDNELKKATLKGKDGTVMTYTVTKLQFNVDAPDSKFVFDKSKYPGYQVIED
ncbi:outer membrane lipoprotein carrier protein LolA [Crocinitomicaceae bacterium CZZ-1]|uniref:Outer membrane lipoprotein carrier protein LolA n=1 Tax=Taishania pollutisoli TaxID=2766479 RepID=A0A8J6PFM8_9FLAO|nr:outer membrane lipoprotein carrier protein LolA [Taishania pollutisoli]MBC9813550.1 outer membrane lipoprotein carrier protein LolA [Taishania pollutisoli]MBX2949058.1 outer membrane lipoprotein carrier protein LolA [Crocinitomicaceae bacterium]NGF76012.1 outer membrane lipoprotein carrier protein LolA [Fluviicola sp. SGL-29]